MDDSKLILRPLIPDDKDSFLEAVNMFKNENPPWEFAFHFDEQTNFLEYLDKLESWSNGLKLPQNFVPNTFLVGVLDGKIIGRISIRHKLNDYLKNIGGHVGYGVISPYRNRGFATEMLRKAIPICSSIGIKKILITCNEDNIESCKVIEKCGGIFEKTTTHQKLKTQIRRYWVTPY